MSCSDTCLIAKSTFHFVQERETYSNARAKCQVLGGDLTANTNQNAWRRLRECCQEQRQFWVGLRRCNGQDTYRSLDQSDSRCRVLPFTVPDRHINDNCKALLMNPGITSGNYPERKLESCNIEHSYICQVRDVSETTSITTSITKTDATTNEAKEVFIERVNPDAKNQVQTTTPKMTLNATETAAKAGLGQSAPDAPVGAIVGGLLAVVILIVIIAAIYTYRKRKWTFHQIRNTWFKVPWSPKKETTIESRSAPVKEDHGYYSVEIQEPNHTGESRVNSSAYSYVTEVDGATQVVPQYTFSHDPEAPSEVNPYVEVNNTTSQNEENPYSVPPLEPQLVSLQGDGSSELQGTSRFSSTEQLELGVVKVDVQYATVRDMSKPNAVYATVNKAAKKSKK
ncbi:unnamed protein product [Clavelina lepadiformis]|uniref:C-type lectin domain-containing protein n=1 Tax=Clavelina lepadiformis TaxID=159417 RepID=A0ABP0GS49_CLALP